jgi:hypothetical protein
MKLFSSSVFAFVFACFASSATAAVTVGHIENATVGEFLTSSGAAVAAGGVSIGIFTNGGGTPITVSDSAVASATSFADLVALGYKDVRSLSGATAAGGTDWDFPSPVSGSYNCIAISALPAGTQLYLLAFNAGSFVSGAPSTSFAGATEWAVIKDTGDHLSPADLGTKSLLLNTVIASDILVGADKGNNVAMASLAAIPEPSRALLGLMGFMALLARRRR